MRAVAPHHARRPVEVDDELVGRALGGGADGLGGAAQEVIQVHAVVVQLDALALQV